LIDVYAATELLITYKMKLYPFWTVGTAVRESNGEYHWHSSHLHLKTWLFTFKFGLLVNLRISYYAPMRAQTFSSFGKENAEQRPGWVRSTFLSIGPMGRGSRTSQTRQYLNTGIVYEASRKFEKEGLGGGVVFKAPCKRKRSSIIPNTPTTYICSLESQRLKVPNDLSINLNTI